MKRIVSSICSVFFAGLVALSFWSCAKEVEEEMPVAQEDDIELTFNIDVVYGDDPLTRVVKTDWEDGDKIFVYFKKNNSSYVASNKFVTITYNANTQSWDAPSRVGSDLSGINTSQLGNSGTMYGAFFPFGNVASIKHPSFNSNTYREFWSTGNTNPALNNYPVFSWYMIDTGSDYTVSGSTVTGTLRMVLPENFVYFYIDAADGKYNQNEKYRLCVEGVKPATLGQWSSGSFSTIVLAEGLPMWGYKYGNGIAFAGIIDDSWATAADHKFIFFSDGDPAVTKTFSGKTLSSHESVNLAAPTEANGWVPYMTAPDYVNVAGNNWSEWYLGSTSVDDVTNHLTFRWGEIVPDTDDVDNVDFRSVLIHSLTGDYAIFDPARAILGADWRMPDRSDFASLLSNSTLAVTNDWFTFTDGGNSVKFATKNSLYGLGGQMYLWTSEIKDNSNNYIIQCSVGSNPPFAETSGNRLNGNYLIRPIYIGSGTSSGSVNKDGYTPTPLE